MTALWVESAAAIHGHEPFFFFFTLVTGPRRSLSLKLSDTRVDEPFQLCLILFGLTNMVGPRSFSRQS